MWMQRTVDLTDMRTPGPTRSPTVALHEDHPSPTDDPPVQEKRRKGTGSLRVSQNQSSIQEDLSEHQRQMQVDSRSFPKRKKVGKSLQTQAWRYSRCYSLSCGIPYLLRRYPGYLHNMTDFGRLRRRNLCFSLQRWINS
jgi:hypothetical protein